MSWQKQMLGRKLEKADLAVIWLVDDKSMAVIWLADDKSGAVIWLAY